MKRTLLNLVLIFIGIYAYAQPDSEVFLFDIEFTKDSLKLSNIRNISESQGYDNQPSFSSDSIILFASTREDQTDIKAYNTLTFKTTWLTDTEASEYSPLKIPGKEAFSAVKLEKDGQQHLYSYNLNNTAESVLLIDDIVIGYHLWLHKNIIISSILKDENLTLTVSDFRFKKHKDLVDNVGRSLHKIPGSGGEPIFSFVDKNIKPWQLVSFDLEKLKARALFEMMPNVEDLIWLNDKVVLSGKGQNLFTHTNRKRGDWKLVASLEPFGITNITRMAISPNGSQLAVVGEYALDYDPSTPDAIVQEQLNAYNYQDIDMFMETYAEDIKLYNYPMELITDGKAQMRDQYTKLFENTPDLYAVIENRTVIGNKVIDKEKVTMNGNTIYAVAIYEVENGLIKTVTFLR